MQKIFGKVQVFGGHGFIGSEYCKKYPEVLVNERDDYNYVQIGNPNVLYMISTVDNYNVHTNPFLDIDTNLSTLIKVLESIKDSNDNDIIFNFISSWFVYGETTLPAREDSYCNPRGFYSITKRAAEQLLISYCETFKIKYRIIRLGNVLGSCDTKASAKKNALQYMIRLLQNNGTVNLYDGGTMIRDYIHVDDVVDGIKLIMDKGNINEIYNLGYGSGVRVGDIIAYVHEKIESKSIIENIPTKTFHTQVQARDMILDTTKIKNLGFTTKVDIKEAINRILEAK